MRIMKRYHIVVVKSKKNKTDLNLLDVQRIREIEASPDDIGL